MLRVLGLSLSLSINIMWVLHQTSVFRKIVTGSLGICPKLKKLSDFWMVLFIFLINVVYVFVVEPICNIFGENTYLLVMLFMTHFLRNGVWGRVLGVWLICIPVLMLEVFHLVGMILMNNLRWCWFYSHIIKMCTASLWFLYTESV